LGNSHTTVYYNSDKTGACSSLRQCLCHFDSPSPPPPIPLNTLTSDTCSNLLTEAECDNLAESLSSGGRTEAFKLGISDSAPKGCYLFDQTKVYYNSDKTGACSSLRQCFCHFD